MLLKLYINLWTRSWLLNLDFSIFKWNHRKPSIKTFILLEKLIRSFTFPPHKKAGCERRNGKSNRFANLAVPHRLQGSRVTVKENKWCKKMFNYRTCTLLPSDGIIRREWAFTLRYHGIKDLEKYFFPYTMSIPNMN